MIQNALWGWFNKRDFGLIGVRNQDVCENPKRVSLYVMDMILVHAFELVGIKCCEIRVFEEKRIESIRTVVGSV